MECAICYTYALEVTNKVDKRITHSDHLNDGQRDRLVDNKIDGNLMISVPDQTCRYEKCGRSYHHACLLDWLRSLPSTRNSFGTLFGSCPYCQQSISVLANRTQ